MAAMTNKVISVAKTFRIFSTPNNLVSNTLLKLVIWS